MSFQKKGGSPWKICLPEKRVFIFLVSIKSNNEWNTLSTIQETYILNDTLGWHLFLGWKELSNFVWGEARCWLFLFIASITTGKENPSCEFPAFSQSHWKSKYQCWLRAGSLKTYLHCWLSVLVIEILMCESVSGLFGLGWVIKLNKDKKIDQRNK